MLAAGWSKKMASAKWTYALSLVMVFFTMNLLVQFTYQWSGKISFSWLILSIVFVGYWTNLTHLSGEVGGVVSGVILFCIFAAALFRGVLALFGTRVQIIGWILLFVLLISALPIFDFRRIFI